MAADQHNMDVIDAAKVGDQHRLRSYLDERNGDVNLRDDSTQGTLLHVSPAPRCCLLKKLPTKLLPKESACTAGATSIIDRIVASAFCLVWMQTATDDC